MTDNERLAIAHALRTPLTSAQLAAGVLSELGPLNHPQREALASLLEDLQRLRVLVERRLDVDRAGAHAGPLEREPISIDASVERAMETLEPYARERGVAVTVSGEAGAVLIVDSVKLQWVITTIVGNAIRYAEREVRVDLDADIERVVVRITDDGPGMDPEVAASLFARGGPSLALFLASEILAAHAGSLEVLPTRRGTCLTIGLPR